MSAGVFIDGRRPKSKKEIRETVNAGGIARVHVEGTSAFGNDYDGPLADAPAGRIDFVGPDPYTKRNFYGNFFVKGDGTVVVK